MICFFESQSLLRVLRFSAVMAGVFVIGCVPIRQGFSGGPRPSKADVSPGKSKVEYQKPEDFKGLGKDAWKEEMEGIASWYGEDFNGRLTASGEVYDMYKFTAAHKTLPLGTVVKVHNLDNRKTVEVRINDRGPYVKGRVIDLSRTAGRAIDIRAAGVAKVKLEIVRWPKGSN